MPTCKFVGFRPRNNAAAANRKARSFQRQSYRRKQARVCCWLSQSQLPLSYIVKKGDTVWDIAVQYGISMKALQEANSLKRTTARGDPLLFEGQVLVIPEKKTKNEQSKEFQRNYSKLKGKGGRVGKAHRDLWSTFTSKVQQTNVEEIDAQVHLDTNNKAKQDILLVVYAPWCEYCVQIEPLIESLAAAVHKDSSIKVMKLRVDTIGTEYWAKEVLHVKSLPTIIALPQSQEHLCIFTGERNQEGLLDFMNAAFGRKAKNRIEVFAAPQVVNPESSSVTPSSLTNFNLLAIGIGMYVVYLGVLFGFLVKFENSPIKWVHNIFTQMFAQISKNDQEIKIPSQKRQTRVEIFAESSQQKPSTIITTISNETRQNDNNQDVFGDRVDEKLRTYRSRVSQALKESQQPQQTMQQQQIQVQSFLRER